MNMVCRENKEKWQRNGEDWLVCVSNVDDNSNVAGVYARDAGGNNPVFNRVTEKAVLAPCSFLAKAHWAFAENAYFWYF